MNSIVVAKEEEEEEEEAEEETEEEEEEEKEKKRCNEVALSIGNESKPTKRSFRYSRDY